MSFTGVILQRLVAVWLAVTLTFFALRLTANDAVTDQLTGIGADPALIQQRRQAYGLDQPLLSQYSRYWFDLLRGDAGISVARQVPVALILGEALGATVTLALPVLILASIIGGFVGIRAGSALRAAIAARMWIVLSVSVPVYWTGTLAILIFSAGLRWLPSSGSGDVLHLILPVGVLAFHTSGTIAWVVEASMRQTLNADFVRTARAKGLTNRAILLRHILRVGLLPVITVVGIQSGFVLGGTVITEILFVRPGLGRVLLDAVLRRDYPVVQAIVALSAVTFAIISTITDFLGWWLDPRIRIPAR